MKNFLKYTAYVLVLIGALNWGIVGLFGVNPIAAVFGDMSAITRIIYSLVGVSAIVTALTMHRCETIENIDVCECGSCGL